MTRMERAALLTDAAKAIAFLANGLSPVAGAWPLTGDESARLRLAIEDLEDAAIDIAEIAEGL